MKESMSGERHKNEKERDTKKERDIKKKDNV